MSAKLLRQWEGGYIFAAYLLSLCAIGIFGLILFIVKGGFSAGLLLPACMVAGALYYARHFFSLWRTAFLVSENGITVIDCKENVREFSWEEIKVIYVRSASDIPSKNDIIFASANIGSINCINNKKLKENADFLFWMSYTKKKENILSQFAESKIFKL